MASIPPPTVDDPCNTETDEETIALRKKRSRRVSFADREITSVHIFNRDEDYETPPDSSAPKSSSDDVSEAEKELQVFFKDLVDGDDIKEMSPNLDEDYDDDVANGRKSFLRPLESPSPGSSILGSATSNDEDNFFGPVSTSFIRPGQLSDSGVSDDNHDVTMDSTVFSLHYRSLARSESGGNTFEEKTPSQVNTPSDSGISMVLANVKKMTPRFSISEKISSGRGSNDMSLVGPRNYCYDKLSPKLEALLAVSSKDLQDVSVSDSPNRITSKRSEISTFDDHVDQKDSVCKRTVNVGELGLSPEGVAVCMELDEFNGNSLNTLDGLIATGCPSIRDEDLSANILADQQRRTPNQFAKLQVNSNYGKDVNGISNLNVEASSGVHPSINGEVPQLDSFAQHESWENQKGSSYVKRRGNCVIDQKSDQHITPVHGSISSVSAKQQEILIDSAKACERLSYVTPSPKQPNSFFGKVNIKSVDKYVSVNKSVSKFQIYEPSPLTSALKERLESSKLRLSQLSSPFNAVAEQICENVEGKNADAVIANLEKRLYCIDVNGRCNERTDVDCAGIQKQMEYGSLGKDEKTKCLVEEGKSVTSMCAHVSFEGADQEMTEMGSPSQLSQLQKIHRQHNLMLEKYVQQIANVSGSDSSLVDIKVECENNVKEINLPDELVSPPGKTMEKVLCSSTKHQGTPLHDLQRDELLSMSVGQDKSSAGKFISHSNSTVVSDVLPESFADEGAQSSSLLSEINGFTDFNLVGNFNDKQNYRTVLKHVTETSPIFRSPSRDRDPQKILPRCSDGNMLVETGLIHSETEVSREWNKASPPASAACSSSRTKKNAKSPLKRGMSKNPIKEPTRSPSNKDQHGLSDCENVESLAAKIIVSPISNANFPFDSGNHPGGISAQNLGKSSERKRRFVESATMDADKYRRVNRNLEMHTSQDANMESIVAFDNTRMTTRSDKMIKHWSVILRKFSKDTEQMVSPLTENFNIKWLSRMQDIVLHLQKVKFFEMLHSQIQSKTMNNHSSEIKHNRIAETKMLLYKLAYEKARLQLMCMERDKVLKKSQQLSSAAQKSQMLKLNRPCLFLSGNKDFPVNNLTLTSDMSSKIELCSEKLATMKHEFEALNRKISNLSKSFNNYFKMKGEPSCSEIIAQLNVYLKKKTSCKIIRDDLQLWEVGDFGSTNLKRNITLNYRGLFCKRFVINDGPTPSVFVSNNLDDINITKNFPSMDACAAFAWILNARSSKKLVGFKSFAQETQITCSLLHNIFDVIGEAQLALAEIRNLVHTRFRSSSVEQLQLQLCFIDFNYGWKLIVTLDLMCLNRGVYPSEVVPSQLEASFAGTCMAVPDSVSARLTAAVDGLRTGYSRIIRLCRCISQVMCSPQAHEN